MTSIETIVVIISAIILLPVLCRWINRPALLYGAYLLVGLGLGDILDIRTRYMLEEVGKIGFILLLFQVGLEIDLPSWKIWKKTLPFCMIWLAMQIPLLLLISWGAGFSFSYGVIASVGINACSLGIAYDLLKSQSKSIGDASIKTMVIGMVILEVAALFLLATSDIVYKYGISKEVLIQIGIFIGFILVIRFLSNYVHRHLSRLLEKSGKWRMHQFLIVLFLITIIGERLGLSAAKTAFFLGLFMKGVTEEQSIKFEDVLKPISQGILIPMFFISLGTTISFASLFPATLPVALAIVGLIFPIRYFIFRKFSHLSLPSKYFLLYCPNLTMVAVAAEILAHNLFPKEQIDLLLAIGLLMTVGVAFLFPARETSTDAAPAPSE